MRVEATLQGCLPDADQAVAALKKLSTRKDYDNLNITSLLDELLQPSQRRVPLQRHLVEILPRGVESIGVDVPDPFAAATVAAYQSRGAQHFEMLGDGLARVGRFGRQLRD